MPTLASLGKASMDLPKTDGWKSTFAAATVGAVLWYVIKSWMKHRKYMKLIEKAQAKGGESALPPEMLAKMASLAGLSGIQAVLIMFMCFGFVMTMVLMP